MKCRYIYDEEVGKVLIPGCMASVIYGVDFCTCRETIENYAQFEREEFNSKMKEKDLYVRELEKEVARLNRILKRFIVKDKRTNAC